MPYCRESSMANNTIILGVVQLEDRIVQGPTQQIISPNHHHIENQKIDSQFFNPALLIVRITLKSPTLSANNSISTAALLLSGHW
jgi:hypothetical protein